MSDSASGCPDDSALLAAPGAYAEHLAGCVKCQAVLSSIRMPNEQEGPLQATMKSGGGSLGPMATSGPLGQGEMIGPYIVGELLASGGMGVLYTAVHPELNRKVALKVIRPEVFESDAGSSGQVRLLREAQAMAQLTHPNVVTVFDAGTSGNKVYLAMELVEGTTLKGWLADALHPWRETLAAFLQAGQGLAAAHRAGLIHRDFKPDNVLVSRDARVLVTDFGLARAASAVSEGMTLNSGLPQLPASGELTATPMTVAGSVMGTPGFMAPEQSRGGAVDARSDQFSFFSALWLGLYGALPYAGRTLLEIQNRCEARQLQPAPANSPVPARVRRVLVRGLSPVPAERFPRMEDALRELERAARPTWRRTLPIWSALAGLGLLGLIGFLATRAFRAPEVAGCDAASGLTADWNEPTRQVLGQGFRATHDANADASAQGVIRALDSYAANWSAQHEAVCTQARTGPAEEATLSALTCFARQRVAFRALVDVLSRPDADIARSAIRATGSLVSPARCRDPHILALMPKLPSDPVQRAQVEELRVKLASANALALAGVPKRALEQLEPLFARAQAMGNRPLEGEIGFALGRVTTDLHQIDKAEKYYVASEKAAEIAGDDLVAASSAANAGWVVGYLAGRVPEGNAWIERADLNLQRAGGDPDTEGRLENAKACLAMRAGKDEEAIAHAERSLALYRSALGPDHPRTLGQIGNVALAYETQCRYEESLKLTLEVIATTERVLGPNVSSLVGQHISVAGMLGRAGRYQEGEAHLDRAQEISRAISVPDNGEIVGFRSALRTEEQKPKDALELAEQALPLAAKATGERSTPYAFALRRKAECLHDLGRDKDALPLFNQSLDILAKTDGPDAITLSGSLEGVAGCLVALGKPAQAVPLVERALKVVGDHCPDPGQKSGLWFTEAKALQMMKKDPARVRQLLGQARDELLPAPWKKPFLDEILDWARAQHIALPPTAPPSR